MKKILIVFSFIALLLVSCKAPEKTPTPTSTPSGEKTQAPTDEKTPTPTDEKTPTLVNEFKIETEVLEGYSYNSETNSYTFLKSGEYNLTGDLVDGYIECASDLTEKVTLNLLGCNITSSNTCISWLSDSSKIEIKAKKDTVNTITTTASDNECNAIESNNNIEFGGKGKLTVTSATKHTVSGSDISIDSLELVLNAKSKGIKAKAIYIYGGSINITAKTGMEAELNKKNKKGTIEISGGEIFITAMVGIKADTSLKYCGDGISLEIDQREFADATPIDTPDIIDEATNLTYILNRKALFISSGSTTK